MSYTPHGYNNLSENDVTVLSDTRTNPLDINTTQYAVFALLTFDYLAPYLPYSQFAIAPDRASTTAVSLRRPGEKPLSSCSFWVSLTMIECTMCAKIKQLLVLIPCLLFCTFIKGTDWKGNHHLDQVPWNSEASPAAFTSLR